jgi:two-component system sensor histidine kinase BaeS
MTLELHRRPLDLAEVVGLAVASWARTLQAAGISVEEDLPPGVIVHADADRVHQIIDNLLANAARYCRVGDSVHVSVAPDGKQGLLRVADTGPGFRAEELPVVFQRTWRGTASTGTRGSGLGLPLVRALAQAHAGTVEVTSVEGQGATITVRLPSATPGG